ncbi:hypothetical protein ACQPTN_21320 [Bradyrhizobium sp. 13971]
MDLQFNTGELKQARRQTYAIEPGSHPQPNRQTSSTGGARGGCIDLSCSAARFALVTKEKREPDTLIPIRPPIWVLRHQKPVDRAGAPITSRIC